MRELELRYSTYIISIYLLAFRSFSFYLFFSFFLSLFYIHFFAGHFISYYFTQKMLFFSPRVPLFLSLLLYGSSRGAAARSPLEGIFGAISPFTSCADLIITYDKPRFTLGTRNSGVEILPSDASSSPSISIVPLEGSESLFLPVNPTQLYTLVMIDPDAPSRANPSLAQILHFVQTGMKVTKTSGSSSKTLQLTAQESPVVPYRGPEPPVNGGLHRYIFLLYSQPDSTVDLGRFSADQRRYFDVEDFARNNTLGKPLAGAYFEAQHAAAGGYGDRGAGFHVIYSEGGSDDDDLLDGPLLVDTNTPSSPARYTGFPTPVPDDIIYDGTLVVPSEPSESSVEPYGYGSSYAEIPSPTEVLKLSQLSLSAQSTPTLAAYSTTPTSTVTRILATGEYNISRPVMSPTPTSQKPSTSLAQYSNAAGKLPVPSTSHNSLMCLAVIIVTIAQVLTTGL